MFRKLSIALITVSMITTVASAAGRGGKTAVIPPYAQLTAEWWLWGFESGEDVIGDPTGEFCDVGQPKGNTWFLAGNRGGETERTCTIPEGKYLFFPILNIVVGAPFPDETVGDLRDQAAEFMEPDLIESLKVKVDGKPVTSVLSKNQGAADLSRFRAFSTVFGVDSFGLPPEENVFVADGYWVMLPPLSSGEHVVEFRGVRSAFEHSLFGPIGEFDLDVTYNITVE